MIGKTLSHYTITAKLGEGGMGEVYRAEDSKLGRHIALKVLPEELASDPERLERFQREAKTVAALSHPNIVTVFSVEEADGVHFLTMELVEGKTLDALLPASGFSLGQFFDLAIPIADAVASAHERGIVHRDLKPANVMVTDKGKRVKVLDFGLAKATEAAATPELTQMPTEALTQEGLVMGTIPYMSPEQVEGKPVDHRTDIFSLGVLFYEMVTGDRPFHGDTSPGLMSSILKDAPVPVVEIRAELPRHLGRIVQRCLEKSLSRRYQTANSLTYELESLRREHESSPTTAVSGSGALGSGAQSGSAQALQQEKSIAVLPFLNRGGNTDDDYFSDGLSEELINALSKLPGIKVTARSSAFQFRGQELDVREVGSKLGVEAVLEGSVRMAGSRLRITTELVNCADGLQLWSERFDSEMKDIFDTQDEIAKAIVEQLEVELGGAAEEPLIKRETENLEAYHFLLKARHHMTDFWEPGLVKAIDCLEKAVELDPSYALAYADMSFCYLLRSIFGTLAGKEAFPRIRSAALKALELDPDLGDAHGMYGIYLAWHDFNWEGAEKELRTAVELNPQNVWNHFYYAGVLATARRGDDILPHIVNARDLDPLNPIVHSHVPLLLFYANRGEEAIVEAEKSLELFPDFWFIYYELSFFLWQRGDGEAAIQAMTKAVEMTDGKIGFIVCFLAAMNIYFGRDEEGERWLARAAELAKTSYISPIGYTVLEVVRQNTDEAIAWLERGRAEHDTLFAWTRAFCEQQNIIADERIREAMERLGLP